jgi:REP element-mobilizing transposase RayT
MVRYWLSVAKKRGFAIDRASVLPDHSHLLARLVPKLSIEAVAFALINNAQYWSGKYFPQVLTGADQLWQPSAYAGTCGAVTTAMIKSFLGGEG